MATKHTIAELYKGTRADGHRRTDNEAHCSGQRRGVALDLRGSDRGCIARLSNTVFAIAGWDGHYAHNSFHQRLELVGVAADSEQSCLGGDHLLPDIAAVRYADDGSGVRGNHSGARPYVEWCQLILQGVASRSGEAADHVEKFCVVRNAFFDVLNHAFLVDDEEYTGRGIFAFANRAVSLPGNPLLVSEQVLF